MIIQSKIRILTAAQWRSRLMFVAAGALWLAAWLWVAPAWAQMPDDEAQTKLRALYEELLLNPADVDKTLEYSALAAEMKDYEAAIAPLERLLLSYPNANKIKLELSHFYHQLGANDAAKTYLNEVKSDSAADAADLQQANQYLAAIEAEAEAH